jgi:thiamine phosphate synthase YjbQ (UPF0047 family)
VILQHNGPQRVVHRPVWWQRTIRLPRYGDGDGTHPIAHEVIRAVPELETIRRGLAHVFVIDASASLTINNVIDDLEDDVTKPPPDAAVIVPVREGALALGRRQGIYLHEHHGVRGSHTLIITLCGLVTDPDR